MRKLIFLLLIAAFACNEIRECDLDPNIEYAVVAFFDFDSVKAAKRVQFSEYYNEDYPNIRYVMDTLVFGFGIPLDGNDTSVTYLMETDTTDYTLTLNYRVNKLRIYSVDCGPAFEFDQLKADTVSMKGDTLTTMFDSVAIIGPTIHKNVPLNVQVYF